MLLIAVSCSPTNSVSVNAENELEETAVPTTDPSTTSFTAPLLDLFDLKTIDIPETATPQPVPSKVPTSTPSLDERPTFPAPLPSPTFSAYGITQTLGTTLEGRQIVSHRYGFGTHTIVIVGGIHGGYEWNTILLSYQLIDYFQENTDEIPNDVTLIFIPTANPDGQFLITQQNGRFDENNVPPNTQPGRFNANNVDLNRNWDCDWEPVGYWGERVVSTGTQPFSEPESDQLARYLVGQRADVVVFLHSAANGIFLGGCPEPLPETAVIAAHYSEASTYPLFENFSSYPVTGDASDWLARQNIPSFSVELKRHGDIEFVENLAGIKAIISYFNQK